MACRIQHLSCFFGQVSQVTAVKADAVQFWLNAFGFQLIKNLNGMRYTGFQCVICVNKKETIIRIQIGIIPESFQFGFKAHDPAMRVGSFDRNIKHLTGQYIGSSDTASDHCGTGTVGSGIRSLCTSESEFHNAAAGSINHTGCFGTYQTLMINNI